MYRKKQDIRNHDDLNDDQLKEKLDDVMKEV